MIKPGRQDVLPIAGYTDREFGEWLDTGFYAFFLENKGRFAFRPMHTFIGVDFDLVEDLVAIYDQLEIAEKKCFRGGIAIAIAKTQTRSDTMVILDALLNLAGATSADAVLDVMVAKLRSEWLSNSEFAGALFDVTLRTVAKLATYAGETSLTRVSIDALVLLTKSIAFPSAYAEAVFVILCELRPEQLYANLLLLRPHLDPELETVETDDREEQSRDTIRRRIIGKVVDLVSTDVFLLSLNPRLKIVDSSGRDWWSDTILSPQDPIIYKESFDDDTVIFDNNGKKTHAHIDRNLTFKAGVALGTPFTDFSWTATASYDLGAYALCFPDVQFRWGAVTAADDLE
jgi:hypothetical protein